MPGIHEIRERIKSISDIRKITNAMYLISSSKLKKARKDLDATEPYFNRLLETMSSILAHAPKQAKETVFFDERTHIPPEKRKRAILIITADKGMCGSYNHNVLQKAEELMAEGGETYLSIMGQVGRMHFRRKDTPDDHMQIDEDFFYTSQNPAMFRARRIAETFMERFYKGEIDDLYVVYTKMTSSIEFEPQVQQLLPLDVSHFVRKNEESRFPQEAQFYPTLEAVMRHLLPNFMKGLIYGAMVESFCSEQQARMSAMDAATTSASDMLAELSLQYNRARQAAITQEISEVCSGSMHMDEEV